MRRLKRLAIMTLGVCGFLGLFYLSDLYIDSMKEAQQALCEEESINIPVRNRVLTEL